MQESNNNKPKTFEEYISNFPDNVKLKLVQIRELIRAEVPAAQEIISYGMPAFKLNGILVYYAGYKSHIGFYPTGSGIKAFEDRICDFKTSKGTIQFPLERDLPFELIREIVQYRVDENSMKQSGKVK